MRKALTLMVQGTTSDAGKSTLVTAICRLLYRKKIKTAPFKPQNMALNSAVTEDGGEIGRAQAVQAYACGLNPHTDMNPILLKPSSDKTAQVIVHGKAIGKQNAKDYHDYKKVAMDAALDSYERLNNQYQAIIIEGAGSPAEINLRANDIANMGFAEKIDCPVILIADIDRGGVFAHIIGTLALLTQSEQDRIKGFVINRFRGDISLLQNGLDWLEEKTGKPVLGVLPYIQNFHLEAEDGLPLQKLNLKATEEDTKFNIIVPALPRISNHTDLDPLRLHPEINLQFIGPGQEIPPADLIIIPGSKSVIADLHWLRSEGWEQAINKHIRYGGKLIGICGGYQMLGNKIEDPFGIEGVAGEARGLGLLDIDTTLETEKTLLNIHGKLIFENVAITGYEIHSGITTGSGLDKPVLRINDRFDGAMSKDNQILGCYIHGLFENNLACNAFLNWAGLVQNTFIDYAKIRESEINRLTDYIEEHLDLDQLLDILQMETSSI